MGATTQQQAVLANEVIDFYCQVGPKFETVAPPAKGTPMINRCGGCDGRLGWSAPQPDRWAAPVTCPRCGRWYVAEARNDTAVRLKGAAWRNAAESVDLNGPVKAIDVIEHLLNAASIADERRDSYRRLLTLPLVGVPLSDEGQPVCEAVSLTLCDISNGGAGLLTSRPFRSPLLVIDFANAGRPGTQVLAELRWRTAKSGVLRVGCRFLHNPNEGLPFGEK